VCRAGVTIKGVSTVLIIDDDAGFRVQVKALLVADGFAVAGEAEDGWSGLEAARVLRPDYVLLDLGLPDVDGFEVADALAGDQESPIVVLTSGRVASDFGPRLTNSRAARFIPKEELSGSAIRTLGEV
jgi:two-component system response regulator EvgA